MAADPEPLLHGTGIDAAAPPRGDEHIPVERYFEVWRRAMALFDSEFPLRVASFFRHEDNEIFGFLAMSCATIGDAFDRTLQYSRLYTLGATYEMDVDREATRITWLPWPGELADVGYRAAMDYHMANMEQAIRQLSNPSPRVVEVRLRHAAPSDAKGYESFYGVAPRFGCRASAGNERSLTGGWLRPSPTRSSSCRRRRAGRPDRRVGGGCTPCRAACSPSRPWGTRICRPSRNRPSCR